MDKDNGRITKKGKKDKAVRGKKYIVLWILVWANIMLSQSFSRIETADREDVVKNSKKPIYGYNIFQTSKALTIGDNEKESSFQSVRNIQVDNYGNIYVLDNKAHEVKIFDESGKLINKFGKKGQGPGEFQLPVYLTLSQNKKIVINDLGNVRIMFFSLEGKLIREVSRSRYFRMATIMLDSKENIIGEISTKTDKDISEIIKFTPDLQQIWKITAKETEISQKDTINLLEPHILYNILKNDNIIWTSALNYKFNILSPEGIIIKTIYKDYQPKTVTKTDKENLIEFWKRSIGMLPAPGIKYDFPKYFPPIRFATIDDEDRLFVQTYDKNENGFYYVDIFDKDGKYIAKIALESFPWIIRKNKMYTINENKEGFQIIDVYNIKWKFKQNF